jgi:hypothetical protein
MWFRMILCAVCTIAPIAAAAQIGNEGPDSTASGDWRNNLVGSISLTQSQFDNWSQGGENTLAWQINLNLLFQYRAPHHMWTNMGKLIYGQARIGNQGTRKSSDELLMESVYQYTIGTHVNPFSAITFQTQFARGYNYRVDPPVPVSDFMDPGYITFSIGAGSTPFEGFTTRLGAAYKVTITDQYATRLTDDPERPGVQKISADFGISSVSNLRKRLADNMLLSSRLELFSNLNRFDEVDVRWDIVISAKVTEFIDVRLNSELLYDSNISAKRQLKQVLSLGFSYTFL